MKQIATLLCAAMLIFAACKNKPSQSTDNQISMYEKMTAQPKGLMEIYKG